MANKLFYLLSTFTIAHSQCTNGNGCGEYATCDVEFVDNAIYGCGGIWEDNGVSNGEYLCADGYSICSSSSYASSLGLTYSSCISTAIPINYFYTSLQSSSGNVQCDETGIDDIFGCANPNSGNVYIDSQNINCGPFGAQISTTCNNCWQQGWEPWGGDGSDELTATRHLYAQYEDPVGSGNWNRGTEVIGGVMCCKDNTTSVDNTTTSTPTSMAPTTTEAPMDFSDAQLERIEEWKSRVIYQILTDRFSKTDSSDTTECGYLNGYCGGTFIGIKNKLDYIQNMGYDTIWISPIVENTPNGYHGYWTQNIYEINSEFGTEDEYLELVDAIHDRGMYLMIDIVINHMGIPSDYKNGSYNYSTLVPFNETQHYHDSCGIGICDEHCSIDNFNFYSEDGVKEVELCRLAGLPDLNQTNSFVAETFCKWLSEYVINKWGADAIRIDTVPEVDMEYWSYFLSDSCLADGVFNIGEFFWGDPAILGEYQPVFDSLIGYPMYYTLQDVFGRGESMQRIQWRLGEYEWFFLDYAALGLFTDNHDNNRWLCDFPDLTNYANALLFMYTFPGIPIGYYGTEQGFNGCKDPHNREVLWTTGFDTESLLYQYISTLLIYRREREIYAGELKVVMDDERLWAYSRGDAALVLLTNDGSTFSSMLSLDGILKHSSYCNVFNTMDCFDYMGGDMTVHIEDGVGKLYVAMNRTDVMFSTTEMEDLASTILYKASTTVDDKPETTKPETTEADGAYQRVYGVYMVIMTVLFLFWN